VGSPWIHLHRTGIYGYGYIHGYPSKQKLWIWIWMENFISTATLAFSVCGAAGSFAASHHIEETDAGLDRPLYQKPDPYDSNWNTYKTTSCSEITHRRNPMLNNR